MTRRALLSVTDKAGVVDFARGLVDLGFELLSTGGTHKALSAAGVPVQQVADHTGFPEILGGRVKTLHPKIHGGLLGQRDDPAAVRQMTEHGIDPIDVVAVNLYRFRDAAAKPGVSEADVVEQIDIGGPSMLRSAAKNWAHVTVVVEPADYERVLAALREGDGEPQRTLRRELAAKAFAHTAAYDGAIAAWFEQRTAADALPAVLSLSGRKVADLRYGENPHQTAAFYARDGASGPSLATGRVRGGKELSYNNLVDLDAALQCVLDFERPACVIVKHTNPCGVAVADALVPAWRAALASDPVSAFGGIVAWNRPVDAEVARAVVQSDSFTEAMVAPGFTDEAVEILQTGRGGKSLRVVDLGGVPSDPAALVVRPVSGGFLAQTADDATDAPMETATERAPTQHELAAMRFAWVVCKHVKSNAIVLATEGEGGVLATVGVGAGQMSRVDAVRIAAEKAGDRARGSVMASDAFFPFADGVDTAALAGVTAVVQPGGSRRDDEVIAAADRHGLAMVRTGVRHFRH